MLQYLFFLTVNCNDLSLSYLQPTTQISTRHGGLSSLTVDGDTNPVHSLGSCSHTDIENDPWWSVQMSHTFQDVEVAITNRADFGRKLS